MEIIILRHSTQRGILFVGNDCEKLNIKKEMFAGNKKRKYLLNKSVNEG